MYVTMTFHAGKDIRTRARRSFSRDHAGHQAMVEVSALIDPRMLIEIEADAEL